MYKKAGCIHGWSIPMLGNTQLFLAPEFKGKRVDLESVISQGALLIQQSTQVFKLNWFCWRPWQARICWVELEQGQNSASCQAGKNLALLGWGWMCWEVLMAKKNPKSSVVDGAPEIPGGCQVKSSESGRGEPGPAQGEWPSVQFWILQQWPLVFNWISILSAPYFQKQWTQQIFQQCFPNKGVKTWLFLLFPSAPLWGMDEWGSSRLRLPGLIPCLGWAEEECRRARKGQFSFPKFQQLPNLLHTTVSCSFLFSTTG